MPRRLDPLHFNYTPDWSDPELLLRRRMAMEDAARSQLGDVNEISRAGLLGSGASFDILGESSRRGLRNLSDVNNEVFGRQRSNAFDLYRDELNFGRQKDILKMQQEANDRAALLEGLGGIGEFLGGGALKYFSHNPGMADYGNYYGSDMTLPRMGESGFKYYVGG